MVETDFKTFDLVKFLAEQDFPETTIDVYFHKKLGFAIAELKALIVEAERADDEKLAKKLTKELNTLVKSVPEQKTVVHLRDISERTRKAILKTVNTAFPPKKDYLGREEDNSDADDLLTRLMWEAHITKIVAADGSVALMSEGLAEALQDQAPRSAQIAINRAIGSFEAKATEGYEFAVKEIDFL